MTAEEEHLGGCQCGRLRYRITGPIDSVVHCHCRMCQESSGGVVMTWATVPRARFAFSQGEAAGYASSGHGLRQFCGTCGTQLTFTSTQAPDEIDITLGSLDRPEAHPAQRHIWTESQLPWLALDRHLPAEGIG